MRLLISFAALYASVFLLQLSSGGVGPLDALVGFEAGFSTTQIGILGSAHFLGFFIGCWWAPRLMGMVGHSRGFAVFTALGTLGLLGHTLVMDAYAWAALRVASGLCIAGCYTVIEAWLNAKITNDSRARTMGIYRIVDIGASLMAQLLIGSLVSVEVYMAYNILALLCCASLLPLALTTSIPPQTGISPKLRPALAFAMSPLGVAGAIVAGLGTASYRMVGPLYGAEVGLAPAQIGIFLACFVGGGALAQFPVGWLADRFDRRKVLIALSIASVFSCAFSVWVTSPEAIYAASAIFGFITFPIFSVASAHAHDYVSNEERVELSAALIFYFAVGAIFAPLVVSKMIDAVGSWGFFAFIAFGHVILAIYGFWRMTRRDALDVRTPYVYAPRTSFTVGRLMKRLREKE
ncbi:MAG: MFS transporter [Planktomarina sp.]